MRKKNKFSIFFWCDVVCSTKNIDVISCCRFSYKKALIHKRFLTNCSIIIIQRVFFSFCCAHNSTIGHRTALFVFSMEEMCKRKGKKRRERKNNSVCVFCVWIGYLLFWCCLCLVFTHPISFWIVWTTYLCCFSSKEPSK